jgi:hypothetical protein
MAAEMTPAERAAMDEWIELHDRALDALDALAEYLKGRGSNIEHLVAREGLGMWNYEVFKLAKSVAPGWT